MSDPVTRLNAALEGRYQIERELGEGGMATVYLADGLKQENSHEEPLDPPVRKLNRFLPFTALILLACRSGSSRIPRTTSSPTRACYSAIMAGGGQAGLSDMPVRERVEHVLTQASKVHPQIRAALSRIGGHQHASCVAGGCGPVGLANRRGAA